MVDKVSSQFRLNRFLPSCLEIKSMRDSLVSGAVVAGLPLATVGVIANGGLCAILGSCRLVTFGFFWSTLTAAGGEAAGVYDGIGDGSAVASANSVGGGTIVG